MDIFCFPAGQKLKDTAIANHVERRPARAIERHERQTVPFANEAKDTGLPNARSIKNKLAVCVTNV